MPNNIIKRIWNQNSMTNVEDLRGSAFTNESSGHTFQISGVDSDGNVAPLAGTVSGIFLRPDNTDVAITGTLAEGVASITLPAECYDVPGRFGLAVYMTANGQKTVIYAAVGSVARTSSGNVSPQTTADVTDLINQISAAVAQIPQSWTGMMADIAPTYSDSAVYPVGAYCYYNGDLYRSVVAITTAESWDASHWETAVIGNDLINAVNAISGKADKTDTVLDTTLSHGRKSGTTAGLNSIAYGNNIEASGNHSAAFNTRTKASGFAAAAFGEDTIASGQSAHAEGGNNEASGYWSHVEGNLTLASGANSHAEGEGTAILHIGGETEKYPTTASGRGAHAEGLCTIANHAHQHSAGEFNVADPSEAAADQRGTYVEIIGNGTANDARSNARTLDWSGNEELAGDLVVKKGTTEEISVLGLKAMIDALTQRLEQLESH